MKGEIKIMPISGATPANYSGMMANSAGMMNGSSKMGNSSGMMKCSMMRSTSGANGLTQAGKVKSTFNSGDSIVKQGETIKQIPQIPIPYPKPSTHTIIAEMPNNLVPRSKIF